MEATTSTATPAPAFEAVRDRVLAVVRELAQEVGGERALRAAAPGASLEREVGLGSLERVELLLRLEAAFSRRLDDRYLQLDTAEELARALVEEGGLAEAPPEALAPTPALEAARDLARDVVTLQQALHRRAESEPDRPHVFLREDDRVEHTVTYGSLFEEARAVAAGLLERGVKSGDTVGLMLPTSRDFLRSFQGILLAGAIPVPIYPPLRLDRLEEYAVRQGAILADARVVVLVTVARARGVAALLRGSVPTLRVVVTADELAGSGGPAPLPSGRGADPALIQYTSGSTGNPKGVLLTHDNLLANIRAIAAGLQMRPTDVGVSWLPLYHDMGLIGSWLCCLVQGLPISILSPLAFLARPERWLWTIHTRQATLSAAPNFAYELCVRKVPEAALQGLDLSSWRCALNGAEPVNPDTLDRFARRFARCGFRREALMPVYGLAECSVALTVPPLGRGPHVDRVLRDRFEREGRAEPAPEGDARALRFVSVGRALPEHELRIVDEGGADVPERVVGRLAFRGPSMTAGYFRRPEETAAITLPGGRLDSGDLGYLANGEVFITGRRKDLIIKAGRNLVPQEIEDVAGGVEGIRKGNVVAFGVSQPTLGTESLVIVAETRETDAAKKDALASAVTDRVAAAVGLPPDVVALVPPGAVPKTSSGKIRRAAARQLYEQGALGRDSRTAITTRARVVAGAVLAELRPRLRSVGRRLWEAYLAVALPLVVLPLWLVAVLWPGRAAAFAIGGFGARLALRLAGIRLSISGLEHLRGRGPFVLAANHASYADVPILMAALRTDFLFVAKKEIFSWPIVGPFARKVGHIGVDRWDTQQSVADAGRVARALEAGVSALFFPEGTFTSASGLRPFRLGAFKTAAQTGTPVLPVALRGTRQLFRADGFFPRPGRIEVRIGPPFTAEGSDWRTIVDLRDRVASVIAGGCGEPRLDLVAGGPVPSS